MFILIDFNCEELNNWRQTEQDGVNVWPYASATMRVELRSNKKLFYVSLNRNIRRPSADILCGRPPAPRAVQPKSKP